MSSTILVDVDGVVADFVGACAAVAGVQPESITQYQLSESMTVDEHAAVRAAMERPDFWVTLPVIAGAHDGIAQLMQHWEVVWCTRPYLPCAGWGEARRWWLREYFPDVPVDNLVITARKDLCIGHNMINDSPGELATWEAARGVRGVLYAAPYNEGGWTWKWFMKTGRLQYP